MQTKIVEERMRKNTFLDGETLVQTEGESNEKRYTKTAKVR